MKRTEDAHPLFETLLRFSGITLSLLGVYVLLLNIIPRTVFAASEWNLYVVAAAVILGLMGTSYWNDRDKVLPSATIQYFITAGIRYFLSLVFIIYSFSKFYRTQLFEPYNTWLDTALGELSGFQLVWSFFGSSYPYALFIGLSQLLCAVLLLFRKTKLLGACLLFPVIGNIVFVNYAYDIPVKFPSTVYLFMTGYLIFTEYPRLKRIFWTHEAIPAPKNDNYFPYSKKVQYGIKTLIIVLLFTTGFTLFEFTPKEYSVVPREISGVWEVQEFSTDEESQLFKNQENRWETLILNESMGGDDGEVKTTSNDYPATYEVDSAAKDLKITFGRYTFEGKYDLPDNNELNLFGVINQDTVDIQLSEKFITK